MNLPQKKANTKPIPKILLQRGRKSELEIKKDLKENYQPESQIYIPAKPRTEQIDDLQCIMETGNKRKQTTNNPKKSVNKKSKLPKQHPLQQRMEEILQEIAERQQFLIEMKQLNSKNYAEYEVEINRQIALRSKEFKALDKMLIN